MASPHSPSTLRTSVQARTPTDPVCPFVYYSLEHFQFGIPLRKDAALPAGYKNPADLKTIRPSIAEIIKGIPELTEKWRDTFGV